jgi:type IV secretory pathway VirD2 relaxase
VVIKSRIVVMQRASPNSAAVHLRYIERDGVTRDGQKGQAYGADTNVADLKTFQERGKNDRHQFRFIVSAEDGLELEDLEGFTRQLMRRMEIDLETRLDWVAVDHWDTGNPHTHIVLNGHTGGLASTREDLVIASDYMAYGMRLRASEIATEWLGPRTEAEIRRSLLREVDQQRLTGLDRVLLRQAGPNGIDLTENAGHPQSQNALRARLQRLEGMGLAERMDTDRWRLQPGIATTLAAVGKREDALETVRRALKGQQRELALDTDGNASVVGRIAGKGLIDELSDQRYLVVDAVDGRAHYLKLPTSADLGDLPMGAIVEARSPTQGKVADRNILAASKNGIYCTTSHLAQLVQTHTRDPQGIVDANVRRLEALRRSGVVERLGDGVWKTSGDLLHKAQQHDVARTTGRVIELRSHLPIEQQVRTVGATWLDRQLVDGGQALSAQGFGAQACQAVGQRAEFLCEQGLAERRGKRIVLAPNLLATLRDRELARVGRTLQEQTGKPYRPLQDGQQASGVYRQSIQLASGRFAMLDDGMGFSLVPWRPVIEQRLGQQVSAVVRGSSATWNLGRQRGMAI